MAHFPITNGEVKPEYLSQFAAKVHRDWLKSTDTEEVVTCKQSNDISIVPDADLFRRVTAKCVLLNWNFNILTQGKRLQRVALTSDPCHHNFVLKHVSHGDNEIGITNGKEWFNTGPDISKCNSNANQKTEYNLRVSFTATEYGTYRQNIIFAFGDYPVLLERLCVDCLPEKDLPRIRNATEYQLSQTPKRWADDVTIEKFQSSFVPNQEPKEVKLSAIYPYPDRQNFYLTQESLADDCLTPTNYRGRLHELISLEELARHEQIARYNEVSYMTIVSFYILVLSGDASTVAKYASCGELFAQLPLSRGISEDTKSGRLFLRGCSKVLFKSLARNSDNTTIFEAHIEDKCTHTVYIRLSANCVKKLNLVAGTELQVQVQFVLNRLPFCECHRAVDSLPDVGFIFPSEIHKQLDEEGISDLLHTETSTPKETWDWFLLKPLLNAEQRKALAVITIPTSIRLPPILLLGPFGTGKTFTIAQALRLLLRQNARHKLLLCTHSNSAADLYVKEFFDGWHTSEMCPRLKPIRIYYKGRNKNTVHPVVQQYTLKGANGDFRDPTEDDIVNCGLIITTLSTSSSLTSLNLAPTHIIIDEAAQAFESEVLIPLALATPNTRIILAGDQMQLTPEIYSNLASECGLGISLLERICGKYSHNHPCRIHLSQNYRAHAEIVKFTSDMFYNGMVQPANQLLLKHPILKPLVFYAVPGVEVLDVHSTGYAHPTEASELADRVLELKNTWPTECWGPYGEGSIGVLSYYAEQVQRIRTELRKRKLFDVSVERLLNVQGKQFTTVFISTVRTRNCCRYSADKNIKDYGFLTNPRLLNTAITRAKCLVAVVGDPVALLTIGSCRTLWQKYLEMADLHGIDQNTLQFHLSQIPELPAATPLNPLAQEFVPRNQQPPYVIEYVSVPMVYPIIHYSPDCAFR